MSPPAALQRGVGAVRRVWGRTPLRIRLVAAVLALVVLALVGSGFAAAATLQHYLLQREDAQLRSAALQMSHGPEQYDERGPGTASSSAVSAALAEVQFAAKIPITPAPASR